MTMDAAMLAAMGFDDPVSTANQASPFMDSGMSADMEGIYGGMGATQAPGMGSGAQASGMANAFSPVQGMLPQTRPGRGVGGFARQSIAGTAMPGNYQVPVDRDLSQQPANADAVALRGREGGNVRPTTQPTGTTAKAGPLQGLARSSSSPGLGWNNSATPASPAGSPQPKLPGLGRNSSSPGHGWNNSAMPGAPTGPQQPKLPGLLDRSRVSPGHGWNNSAMPGGPAGSPQPKLPGLVARGGGGPGHGWNNSGMPGGPARPQASLMLKQRGGSGPGHGWNNSGMPGGPMGPQENRSPMFKSSSPGTGWNV